MKKIVSIVLISIMLLCMMPFTAFAGGDELELTLDTPYEVWIGESGETFRFSPEQDGWYRFYTDGEYDTYASLYNSNWDRICDSDDTSDSLSFNLVYKLYAGYTYYLEVGAYLEESQLAKFNLYATQTVGVEDVYISKAPDNKECIIGLEHDSIDLTGMEVTLTLSDSQNVVWSFDEGGDVAGNRVDVQIGDDGSGHYFVAIECGEGYDKMFFDMVENPVESISIASMDPIEIYENSSGYDEGGKYIYNYQIPYDTKMQINYKDGTNAVVDFYGLTDDGFYFGNSDDQYTTPWGIGENEITIDYMGCTTTVSVKILPCPYKSATVLSSPSRVYYYGDNDTGYTYDGDYILCPDDLTGLSFELEYSDGTSEVIDEDNIDMGLMEIDGYMYEIGEYPVSGAGDVWVTLSYKGMDIKYLISVLESPIDSVEVIKAPDKYEYEDRYHADYTGMQIKVNFKDCTEETVTLTKDNMTYILNGSLECKVPVREYTLTVARQYNMSTDGFYTTVSCVGVTTNYDGIIYTQSRDVEIITKVENFAYDTDGMTVYIKYKDLSEESLTYTPVDYYDYGDGMYEGFAYTENGITYFDIYLESKNEASTTYTLYTLNTSIEVEVPNIKLGDVDGDGEISILDATVIQRHLAKLTTLSETQLLVADTDKDGAVTILDATVIQRFLAKLITEF